MIHKFCKSQLFCPDRYRPNEDRTFTHCESFRIVACLMNCRQLRVLPVERARENRSFDANGMERRVRRRRTRRTVSSRTGPGRAGPAWAVPGGKPWCQPPATGCRPVGTMSSASGGACYIRQMIAGCCMSVDVDGGQAEYLTWSAGRRRRASVDGKLMSHSCMDGSLTRSLTHAGILSAAMSYTPLKRCLKYADKTLQQQPRRRFTPTAQQFVKTLEISFMHQNIIFMLRRCHQFSMWLN